MEESRLKDLIFDGRDRAKGRWILMSELRTSDKDVFDEELRKLRETKIVTFNNGYYYPTDRKEIEQIKAKAIRMERENHNLVNLCTKELEKFKK